MSITYFSGNKILDRNFGLTAYSPPSTMYFGLSSTTINIDGTGATEPSGGAYARVGVTNDKTTWGTAASAALTNSIAVTFPESTASWGTITGCFISDALTSGNIWFYDLLTPSRTIATSTTAFFAIGAITVQMTNS